MSSRPIDVAGAFARWHKRVILDLAGPAPEDLPPDTTVTTEAEAAGRAVFIDALTNAIGQLMRSETEDSALIFAVNTMMDLHGTVIGSMHERPCPGCMEGSLHTPIAAFMRGFSAEAKRNAKAEPARAEVLQ